MNQMLDLGETDSLAKDVAGLEDWFEAAVQTSHSEILPKRTAIRSSWGDDDEEAEDDDLPEEATPEQEDDEPDPFDESLVWQSKSFKIKIKQIIMKENFIMHPFYSYLSFDFMLFV